MFKIMGVKTSQSQGKPVITFGSKKKAYIQAYPGHTQWIHSVVTRADGKVITASYDDTVRIWDLSTGQSTSRKLRDDELTFRLNMLSDGRVIGFNNKFTIQIWDPDFKACQKLSEAHTNQVWSITSDNLIRANFVASASNDKSLRLWDLETGESALLDNECKYPYCAITTSGMLISVANGGLLKIWDPNTGESKDIPLEKKMSQISGLTIVSNTVVIADLGGSLATLDLGTNKFTQLAANHEGCIECIAKLPDGRIISGSTSSGSKNDLIRVWDLKTLKSTSLALDIGSIKGFAILPTGNVVCASRNNNLHLLSGPLFDFDKAHGEAFGIKQLKPSAVNTEEQQSRKIGIPSSTIAVGNQQSTPEETTQLDIHGGLGTFKPTSESEPEVQGGLGTFRRPK